MALFVRIRFQRSIGKRAYASVSAYPSRTTLTASFGLMDPRSPATRSAFSSLVLKDSWTWIALSMPAASPHLDFGTLENTLRQKRAVRRRQSAGSTKPSPLMLNIARQSVHDSTYHRCAVP